MHRNVLLSLFLVSGLCQAALHAAVEKAPLVKVSADGSLSLRADERGDRIPDFSHAGYLGGGESIPLVPARFSVAPSGGDDTARLQAAIDQVAALVPDSRGFRGAILLLPGTFRISGSLLISASGLVLRGSGEGEGGTVLLATGDDRRSLLRVAGPASPSSSATPRLGIVDERVSVGSNVVTLDLSGDGGRAPRIGDLVRITRPGTADWFARVGMHQAPGPTGYYWRPGMVDLVWTRRVVAVSGSRVTLDAPLTTALERGLGGGWLSVLPPQAGLSRVGLERLYCISEYDRANPLDEEHAWNAVEVDGLADGWVRNLRARHFAGSAVLLGQDTRRITVADCSSEAPVSELAGHRRHSFLASGQQHLFLRCRSEAGRHDFAAGYGVAGPLVFLECRSERSTGSSGSVGSWASGLLFDNFSADSGRLGFDNLEITDQGTGWNAADSVLWQCSAPVIVCRRPPGANNWAVGVWGQFLGDGVWQTPNGFAEPDSLYRAQLAARLGRASLRSLEAPVWPAESARELEPPVPPSAPPAAGLSLSLHKGWLRLGERLLHGGQREVAWWRGQLNPARAATVDLSLTRFAPGRRGPGLTDELPAVADALLAAGTPVLRHHYGLWYDRRRDDHEMVRRNDAGVWPPFYELPWARSGQGTTWNGLSRYDLTRFNPWYFRRLREFAGLASERGLVLVNEMYFQHNILEAGAHWVDFPWRPANALQETGFPEPPPFVGGKRIFMAEPFYDVAHPVRRPLHEAYIRQCLANLAGHTNVIHTLGEEFTGPLEFARFWADVVASWRAATPSRPLVCLSATKDVQDALLADPARAAAFDVIELKYWWRSRSGLFAPGGGRNLAPRQSEREWKGGRPDAASIASMVWEYRSRFPDKAVMVPFAEADGWATLAAGGSLPRLPAATDEDLLRLLPLMEALGPVDRRGAPVSPTAAAPAAWLLAEAGRHAFVYLPSGGELGLRLPWLDGGCRVRELDLATGALSPARAGQASRLSAPSGRPAAFLVSVSE